MGSGAATGNEFTEGDGNAVIYWSSSSGLYRAGNGGVSDFATEDIDRDGMIASRPDHRRGHL